MIAKLVNTTWPTRVYGDYIYIYIIEGSLGSLEVKLPTIWTVEKQR